MQGRIPEGSSGRRDSRGRRSLRGERGGALIEIMMAALLVALAATAVFKGIDGASALSGGSKSRAIAASIAENDQERLRAMPPADLVDRNDTNTVNRSGVNYTVVSSTRWTADRDATPDCSSSTSRTGYLRIQSTVSWPDMRGSQPVVATSLVAPPNGTVTSNRGAIGIKILNEANAGVQGVSVAVSGLSPTKSTDVNGCAYWDDVPQGNYSYTAQKAGNVDYEGDASVTRPIGVAGGQTRFDSAYIDVAKDMNVRVVTRRYGATTDSDAFMTSTGTGTTPNLSLPLHLTNAKMADLNGIRSFPASTLVSRSVTGLYPLTYGVFVGACALANNPATYGVAATATLPYANPVNVSMPAINLRGRRSGLYVNGYTVKYTLLPVPGSTCTTTYTRTTENVPGVGDGAIKYPEMPYGRYTICGEAFYSNAWWRATRTVDNTSPGGVNVLLDEAGAVQGRC